MEIIPASKFDACPSGSFNLRFQKFAGCARSDEMKTSRFWLVRGRAEDHWSSNKDKEDVASIAQAACADEKRIQK
jgi:hypothetical protein